LGMLKTGIAAGNGSGAPVVVDASNVHQFDSSAIAVLLDARREALSEGRSLLVQGLPPALARLAQVYGVGELLPVAAE
jgi:phospholipid transport system transporter-binding protein